MSVAERLPELRTWYRSAVERRRDALSEAAGTLLDGDAGESEREEARTAVRAQAHALAGSGGSYGFPLLSQAASFVEHADRSILSACAVGLADLVADVVHGVEDDAERRCHGWLERAVGPLPDGTAARLLPGPASAAEARSLVRSAFGDPEGDLTGRIAKGLNVAVADLEASRDAAVLLVPPRLALDHGLLPLREDGTRLWAAAANPTDVRAMLSLRRLTGRTPVLEVAPPGALARALEGAYGAGSAMARPTRGDAGQHDGPPVILLVDDDEGTRLFLRAVLQKGGLDVVEAGDGIEGLERLEAGPVDLVVVDLEMPRMDGRAFLRELRSGETRPDVPAIVVTGEESAETELDLIESGADDYLRKPVEPRLFLARVRSTLRRLEAGAAAP